MTNLNQFALTAQTVTAVDGVAALSVVVATGC